MGTYTYALVPVSKAAFDEIKAKLREAGYEQHIEAGKVIDMHGLALELKSDEPDTGTEKG